MDDDDFGGFEAAESFEFGNGEKQTTSPAIAWAAFPTGMDKTTIKNLNIPLLALCIHSDIPVASSNVIEDKTLNTSTTALIDAETNRTNEPKSCLQQAVANLKTKKKNSDFLKEKKEKVLSHQDHYKTLQEKHKQELEDMRKAGHEALTIIVEEFKALLQSTVQQQEAAIEKQYILAIEKHSHKCEELLDAQVWMCTCKIFHAFLSVSTLSSLKKKLTHMIPKENDPSFTLFCQHNTTQKFLKIINKDSLSVGIKNVL
uniref:Coiled-coil domain containing 91 n=1 Tax=Malurus cyaneus samueli TaxID=2593467 RepID=A0A8C5UB18_9PASS